MNKEGVAKSNHVRDFSLTFIQLISAMAVVTLHTNGCFWEFSATKRYWYSANIIECVCYFAVPVFFMITGITLLDYQDRYTTKEYLIKRTKKTVIPYIAWSFIGIVFLLYTGDLSYRAITPLWVINGLLTGDKIIGLYWFFIPLFCTYLCIPAFAAIEKKKKRAIAKYLLITGMLINVLPPFFIKLTDLQIQWNNNISIISGYLFWVWCGYYLYYYPPNKSQKTMIYCLSVIGLVAQIMGTYKLSIEAGSIQTLFKGYVNLPNIMYTTGVFIFLKDIAGTIAKCNRLRAVIVFLGKFTLPLYLMQWFWLKIFENLQVFDRYSLFYRLAVPYLILFLTVVITLCMKRTPGLRAIVP